MSRVHSHPKLSRLLLISGLMLALLSILVTAPPTLAFQEQPLMIVRNDGATFPILSSNANTSPSHAVTISAESFAAATEVGAKDLKPVGSYGPESVIGTDERTQVANTSAYPNSAIAQLEVDFPSGSGICTGWFIAKNRLATAGHCVYDATTGEWATAITVYPGRNGGSAPFGSYNAVSWYTVNGWISTGATKYDYGLVKLGSKVGNTVGWFGYGWTSNDAFLYNRKSNVRGYPGDKAYGTMWTMKGRIQQVGKTRLFYSIDTYGGQSGSPHYGNWENGCNPCGFGIHTYGVGGDFTRNSSTRITQKVFNFLQTAGTQ